jgi:hypothetical protein
MEWDGVERINLAHDKNKWRAIGWTRYWTFGFHKVGWSGHLNLISVYLCMIWGFVDIVST